MARYRAAAALLALLIPATALGACDGDDSPRERAVPTGPIRAEAGVPRSPFVVGYGRSTEQRLLAEIHARALRAAGYRAETAPAADLAGALRRAEIDAYPERVRVARRARDVLVTPATPYDSGAAVAVSRATARRGKLETLSDLSKQAGEATLSGPRNCRRRPDCLPAIERTYGVRFRRFLGVRPDLRHEPLRKRRARAGVVHSTDPQLIRNNLVLLADDRHAFPPAAWTLLVREQGLRGSDAAERLTSVAERAVHPLSAEVMQELVARVAIDERSPARVARQYLRRAGLVAGRGAGPG
jgi:osmoprotectant transport system substrate-binding protein